MVTTQCSFQRRKRTLKRKKVNRMETSEHRSFFGDLKSREINGFRVKKRPFCFDDSKDLKPIGALSVEHGDECDDAPPMAASFGRSNRNASILALADEGGYVTLLNTRQKFDELSSYQENAEKAKVCEWLAHDNAVFDLCWIKNDASLLTASGDQSIKVRDVQTQSFISSLIGHTGSIKSISNHPTNQDLIMSGSRDGSFALWDTRCSRNNCHACISPISVIHKAHASLGQRRAKDKSTSITSVLYLKDEVSVATAGAVDSVIKFWDTRNLKNLVTHACPRIKSSNEEERMHGISSLSQDLNGVFITASCMDHKVYLYNVLQLEKGPIKTLSGSRFESFFVKSAISPDAAHIISGSSDGNAYLWQVNKPQAGPIKLKSHDREVTAVDWCQFDMGMVATCSDDLTVRLWNIESSFDLNKRSPSSFRKRVMAFPSIEGKQLLMDDASSTEANLNSTPSSKKPEHVNSFDSPQITTPESQKKKLSFASDLNEDLQKTPECETNSPYSVLNPPSSLKRKTIRDYFIVS